MIKNFRKKILIILVFFILFFNLFPITYTTVNSRYGIINSYYNDTDSDIDQKIQSYMKAGHMPSVSTCIVKNNSLVWSKTYGHANILSNKKATDDTIYLAGSISKTITSTAFMILYEKGLVDLDEDANNYLPFKLRNPKYPDVNITIRMLLSHQSSLSDISIRSFLYFSFFNHSKYYLKEFVCPGGSRYNLRNWRNTKPGEYVYYSNLGFEILGYIIELISDQSYEKFCKKNIFEPLGMFNTSFEIDDLNKSRLVTPYLYLFRTFIPLHDYEMDNACASAGGLRTTVLDLSRFLIVHMNNGIFNGFRLLNESTINLMHTIQPSKNNNRHALGWQVWRSDKNGTHYLEGHAGEVPGGTSFMFYREPEKTGIIIFINQFTFKNRIIELTNCFRISDTLFEKAKEL